MSNPREKGMEFENRVIDFLQKALGERGSVGPSLLPIEGASGGWQADIVIGGQSKAEGEPVDFGSVKTLSGSLPVERAIIECKYAEPADSGSSFDTNLARAYVRLNDIRLKNHGFKLFVVVNREPRAGEQSRNYRKLFGNIGVLFLDFNDLDDRERLETEALALFPAT